jgi:hypothetical protein
MLRKASWALLAIISLACAQDRGAGRVRPPEDLPCSRDQLTSYIGEVADYSRSADAVKLAINTDWHTKEAAELRLKAGEKVEDRFRIEGAPFAAEDFAKIEAEPGKLKSGMRANVWVCEDSGPALIDWRPKR